MPGHPVSPAVRQTRAAMSGSSSRRSRSASLGASTTPSPGRTRAASPCRCAGPGRRHREDRGTSAGPRAVRPGQRPRRDPS
ncbi:hypothetical protein L083_2301 [Actinoplanes sp. N902-109]|nr:hypothetical protein L083_2301 [Actinoplanes sp. N902-109]